MVSMTIVMLVRMSMIIMARTVVMVVGGGDDNDADHGGGGSGDSSANHTLHTASREKAHSDLSLSH